MSVWLVAIIIHATAAVVAFITGFFLLQKKYFAKNGLMTGFIAASVVMTISVVIATISHWAELSNIERFFFSALPLLASYMVSQAIRARSAIARKDWAGYVDNVGFGLIGYFNGFWVVLLVDLGAPAIVVALAIILAIIAGNRYLHYVKMRL